MKVIIGRPPLWDEIDAAFHVAGKPVFFAWGDCIYNPEGLAIPPALKAHERVHMEQQRAILPTEWWRRYIADAQFRLDQEIPAHRAEFTEFCRHHSNKNRRAEALEFAARRLSGNLYGCIIPYAQAWEVIAHGP
jgi:hypothetical protein